MQLLNFLFENTYFSLNFRTGLNPSIIFSTDNNSAIQDKIKVFGYLAKIILQTSGQDFKCIPFYIYFPENFPVFLENMTETFKTSLNNKNTMFAFIKVLIDNLNKNLSEKFAFNSINLKIEKLDLGAAELNEDYQFLFSKFNLNGVYQDEYKIILKKDYYSYLNFYFCFDVFLENTAIDPPSLFNGLTSPELQRLLNIFLQRGFKINQISEIIYYYPDLGDNILKNISKKNQSTVLANINFFQENKIDIQELKNSIAHNITPALINIIDENNFKIPGYLKYKNIREIYEYYKMKNDFFEKPFSYWFDIILHSSCKRIYESKLLKKEFLPALSDVEQKKLRLLFENISIKAFSDLIDNISASQKNSDRIKILRSKSEIVKLINSIELPDELIETNKKNVFRYLSSTNDDITIQYLIRNIVIADLFLVIYIIKDSDIARKFYRNLSKNLKKDFKVFKPADISNFRVNTALLNISKVYERLFEDSKLKKQ